MGPRIRDDGLTGHQDRVSAFIRAQLECERLPLYQPLCPTTETLRLCWPRNLRVKDAHVWSRFPERNLPAALRVLGPPPPAAPASAPYEPSPALIPPPAQPRPTHRSRGLRSHCRVGDGNYGAVTVGSGRVIRQTTLPAIQKTNSSRNTRPDRRASVYLMVTINYALPLATHTEPALCLYNGLSPIATHADHPFT